MIDPASLVGSPLVDIINAAPAATIVADHDRDMIGLRDGAAVDIVWRGPRHDRARTGDPKWVDFKDGAAALLKCRDGMRKGRIPMLRALDADAALAFYNEHNLGGPKTNDRDKVMVRVHKERIQCPGLTEEERAVSQKWLTDRANQRRR